MSTQLWQGRAQGPLEQNIHALNKSIQFDQRLYPYDIQGSIAHARMLGKQGIITTTESQLIINGLESILNDLNTGHLAIDQNLEDIHTFVELTLTDRIGEAGKKLHTGRSRNDQVALDLRLYLNKELPDIHNLIGSLQDALNNQIRQHQNTLMPGYTHMQAAQPITFSMHLDAYVQMLARDKARLEDCQERVNWCPLGAGALAGSTFPLNRQAVADDLHMNGVLWNTLDAVSSRDFALEALSVLSILMTHLSRFSEEIVFWNTQAVGFVTLHDSHTTGSSMMPQKKNPDVAELVRGKTGRVFGDLMTLLTVMKALPLAYNKDMQEDKEALFDAVDTVKLSLAALTICVDGLTVNPKAMYEAAQKGFLNATDLADYLARKSIPFREAYGIVGQVVAHCVRHELILENLPLEIYQTFSQQFEADLFDVINLKNCLKARQKNTPYAV